MIEADTSTSGYLVCRLELDVGDRRLDLDGVLGSDAHGLRFLLAEQLPPLPGLVPKPGPPLPDPLGLTGVTLTELYLGGLIPRTAAGYGVPEIIVRAAAVFPKIGRSDLTLRAALIVVGGTVRLAVVSLLATTPLTLTELLMSVLNIRDVWGRAITDQFAFCAAELYRCSPAGDEASFDHALVEGGKARSYKRGYHLHGQFRVFGEVYFDVVAGIDGEEIEIGTTVTSRLGIAGILVLDNLAIELARKKQRKYIRIRATTVVFGTAFADVTAEYDLDRQEFLGTVAQSFGPQGDPPAGMAMAKDLRLSVRFAWAGAAGPQPGLRLVSVDGLPTNAIDLAQQFCKVLNELPGGCEKIVAGWLKGLVDTSLSPALNGSPTRRGEDKIHLPLNLTYAIKAAGKTLVEADIGIAVVFGIPKSLDDLPGKLWHSLVDSAEEIARLALKDKNTFRVIGVEVSRRAGLTAAAAFICRAIRLLLLEIGQAIVAAVTGMIATTIAELIIFTLQVVLLAVAFLVLALGILGAILRLFGGSKADKQRAQDEIRKVGDRFSDAKAQATAALEKIRGQIRPGQLTVTFRNGNVVADVAWQRDHVQQSTDSTLGGEMSCEMRYLAGDAGSSGAEILHAPYPSYPAEIPIGRLGAPGTYRMNAETRTILRAAFLSEAEKNDLREASRQLAGIDDDDARTLSADIAALLARFEAHERDGIASDWVRATTDVPTGLTIGRSWIGVNSRLNDGRTG